MPTVSIITTTYNHKKFIAQTIESILAQSYTDRELLIGDDSPDSKAWDIIQSYVKKYPDKIKARHHKPGKWLVNNMRFLCEQSDSNSTYFAFLEWDDLWIPSYLEDKIAVFTQNPHVHLVYNNIDLIDENWTVFLRDFFAYKWYTLYKNCHGKELDANIFSYSTSMVTKWVYNKIWWIPNHNETSLSSDNFFHYSIYSQYEIYGIDRSLTLHRKHKNNNSKNYIKLYIDANNDNELLLKLWMIDKELYYKKKAIFNLILGFNYSYVSKKHCRNCLKKVYALKSKLSFIQKMKLIVIMIMCSIPSSLSKKIAQIYYKFAQ